jgi:hypothetical protein
MTDSQANLRREVAVHEVGHTVVAMALEVPVLFVTIVPEPGRPGHCEHKPTDDPETEGMIAVGGHAAEERWKVRESPRIREKMQMNWPGEFRVKLRSDHYKLLGYAKELHNNSGWDIQHWINGRLIKADDILREHWTAAESLVQSLLAEDTLSGVEVSHMWQLYSAKPSTTAETHGIVEKSDMTKNT